MFGIDRFEGGEDEGGPEETMTNLELAQRMRELAVIYEDSANQFLPRVSLMIHADTKEDALNLVHALGGKFTKRGWSTKDDSYFVYLDSQKLPGVSIMLNRSSVCHRVVTWDCEPLLSQEEEAEVEAAING